MKFYPIPTCPKPRMTRSDKWKKPARPCVQRYRDFKDMVRLQKVQINPGGDLIVFLIKMPKSWSEKKKKAMNLQPHQVKPDKDNLEKALLDAVFGDDSHIWSNAPVKLWSREEGFIIVEDFLNFNKISILVARVFSTEIAGVKGRMGDQFLA